jgi:hypothetical protein
MHAALGTVVFVVVAVSALIGLLTFEGARRSYEQIGRSVLALPGAPDSPPPPEQALEHEIRAFVEARNERRARAGRPPLDVDAEVARQLAELG